MARSKGNRPLTSKETESKKGSPQVTSSTNTVLVHKAHPRKNKMKLNRHERSVALSHDNIEKREEGRLKLHISKTQREIELLRQRLTAWDEIAEQSKVQAAQTEALTVEENKSIKKKKTGRLGPETWKLRGAARPASEVYSFDTRYVCPFETEHKQAAEKAQRVQNILYLHKGQLGHAVLNSFSPLLSQTCREFIAALMRLGLLNIEAKKIKHAKEAFLEILDLEGNGDNDDPPLSTARCKLMQMYLGTNRPDSARSLWERLPRDRSVWIRYSAALIEFVSWKLLHEKESTEVSAEALLVQAIQANVFCAYYIAYHATFSHVVEFVEDVEDAEDGTVEQAIEYCNSEQMSHWIGTEGAIDWIRSFLLQAIKSKSSSKSGQLSMNDVDWESKLCEIELQEGDKANDHDDEQEEDVDKEPDTIMYAGMFRTAMDMLTDDGAFL